MMCSVYSCLCAYTCFGDTDLLGRFEKRTNERKDNTLIRMCVFAGLVWRDSSICFGNWGASPKTVFQTEQQFFVILFRAQMKQALHAAYLITSKFILIWIVDVDMCVCMRFKNTDKIVIKFICFKLTHNCYCVQFL